jgi:hypothetical protein
MLKTAILIGAALIASAALSLVQPVQAGGVDVRMRAALSGKTLASGRAEYRERMRGNVLEQRFSISVEDATPGAALEVTVNGVMFGTVIVNALGNADLQFRTTTFIDDPGDGSPIPTDFPRLQAGDVVTAGGLSGSF